MNIVGGKTTVATSSTSSNVLNGIPIANLARPGTVRVRAKQIGTASQIDVQAFLVIGTMSLVNGVYLPSYYVPGTPTDGDPTQIFPTLMDADLFDGPVTQGGIIELTFRNTSSAAREIWWDYAITF